MKQLKRVCFAPNLRMIFAAATLLLWPGDPAVAAKVYRCVDAAGHTEFRQTQCVSGSGQRLHVEAPKIGWLKSKVPPAGARPRPGGEQDGDADAPTDASPPQADEQRCWRAQQRLQRIQWQLRKGYKRAQGERLRQQRREQESFVGRFCK